MAGEWEKTLPGVAYYHQANTLPRPMVQVLTVLAEEITRDDTSWSLVSDRFIHGRAMYLANEFNWLGPHPGAVPFPQVQ